jgi:hypothetical protein
MSKKRSTNSPLSPGADLQDLRTSESMVIQPYIKRKPLVFNASNKISGGPKLYTTKGLSQPDLSVKEPDDKFNPSSLEQALEKTIYSGEDRSMRASTKNVSGWPVHPTASELGEF